MELLDYERKHIEILRDSLAECTVLLKTDGSFPLAEAGELALFGSGARQTVKGGTGSGEVNSRYFVSVEEGLKAAGFRLSQVTHDLHAGGSVGIMTDYEKKFYGEGKPICRLVARKA